MTDVPTILAALQTRLASIDPGLRAHDVWPGKLNPPAIVPLPVVTEGEVTFGGSQSYEFDVILVGGPMQTDYERSQRSVYRYMPLVKEPLLVQDSDGKVLEGIADYIIVSAWEEPGEITVNGTPYFGVKRRIQVVD